MKSSRVLLLAPLQIAQALVGFGAIAAFTRLMSPEAFGRYALALSAAMLAHTLVFTWAEAAAFRYYSSARAETRLAQHFATLLAIAAALGGAVLLLAVALLTLCGVGDNAGAIAAFAAGSAVFRFITRLSRESERAALDLHRYAVRESAYLLLGFAAGVALLLYSPLGAAAPFAGAMLAGVMICAADAPRLLGRAEQAAPAAQRTIAYARYGAPLALALALDLGAQTLTRLIVAHQSGEASLGAYAAAFGLTRPLDLMFIGFSSVFAPLIYAAYEENGADAARAAARTAFSTLAAVMLPAATGLALVATPLSSLMVGPALHAETARVLPWMALAAAASGLNLYYWSEAFQLTRKTATRAAVMLAPAAVQIICTIALAHTASGAAQAAAAGAMCGSLALVLIGRRLIALPIAWRELTKIAAATALMALVIVAAQLSNTTTGLALGVALGVCSYAAAAFALDILGVRRKTSAVSQALVTKLPAHLHVSFTDRLHVRRPS